MFAIQESLARHFDFEQDHSLQDELDYYEQVDLDYSNLGYELEDTETSSSSESGRYIRQKLCFSTWRVQSCYISLSTMNELIDSTPCYKSLHSRCSEI
jgi:hypothetical protein